MFHIYFSQHALLLESNWIDNNCCFSFICSIMPKWFQIWKVSQNDQTVHSCAPLLSCYLCQLTWWVGPLKKMHPQNKMLGSDLILFSYVLDVFYFLKGSCPLILFRYPIGGLYIYIWIYIYIKCNIMYVLHVYITISYILSNKPYDWRCSMNLLGLL